MLIFTILLICQLNFANGNLNQQVHRRFEYKYSFKPPYLAQRDGSVPFWEYGGNAIASSESVRVAPSLRSQKGAIWTKSPTNFDYWEVEIVFRVSGRGRIGADGLALWYTAKKGEYTGDVFGSSDSWNGLGIFFDSFDNDNKHNNPYIMAVLNDGTRKFDHQNDGTTQLLAGCLRDFRNKPFPTRARVEYYKNTLTVLFHNGMTNNNDDYEMCLRAEGVILPKNGYFGVSAATGGLADDHDVFHFLTTSLHDASQFAETMKLPEAESAKLTQEYEDYQKKMDIQREEYRKDHPEAKKEEDDDWFETDNQRELRQIFQSHSHMTEVLRDLSRKMDEVIGRQETTLGLLSTRAQGGAQIQQGGAPPPQQGGVPPPQQGYGGDSLQRHEINTIISNQNTFLATVREIKAFVQDLQTRTEKVLQNQARQPTAQIQGTGGYDVQSMIVEMRDGLNQVKLGIQAVGQKISPQAQAGGCPTTNCLGLTAFLVVTAVQLSLMLAYTLYK
ncbi:Protein ERGIC-53 [Pseudolycoriella hygida]|uniref:Protein ERGIC-53 n=1 Tax=Pseudolycoriella hygida TaxID=35572 RepID=A0A9Q0MN07_9DIPT|nr:Protein ERGIC-53 [Pseudolycoriella hygida]